MRARGKTGLDLSTREGVLRFVELRRGELHAYYSTHGELKYKLYFYIFATHELSLTGDPENPARTGRKLPKVAAIPCPIPPELSEQVGSNQLTRFAGHFVKGMVQTTKAIGVLLAMDSWVVTTAKDDADRPYGWIAAHPDKGEGLYVSLEHLALPHPIRWTASIERDPLRVSPWKEYEVSGVGAARTTRLSNFIDDWRS